MWPISQLVSYKFSIDKLDASEIEVALADLRIRPRVIFEVLVILPSQCVRIDIIGK